MTDVANGTAVAVRLPAGAASAAVGPPVMGPPGLRGQRGERGDPGGTTTIVFSFSNMTPADLPEDGLIPAGWDDVRVPEAPIQVGVGQSVEYRGDGYLYLFLGPSALPGGWIETGQVRGPPGDTGPIGDTGPPGPVGDRGLTGNTGSPGPKGDQGDSGPQGARGADGAPGTPGATGPKGDRGDHGDTGPEGPPGPQGAPGADGQDGAPGAPGADGQDGAPGAPSFIVMDVYTKGAQDVASIIDGVIPAGFDGAGKPPANYQMKVGEAVLISKPDDLYEGQAIVWLGVTGAAPQPWIAMKVTGPQGDKGDQGDTGPQGGQGIQGPAGTPGSVWYWSPIAPPLPGTGVEGDKILCLLVNPDAPGHGDVLTVLPNGTYNRDGNIRGPAGPQGPQGEPGEVQWADVFPIVQRIDALENRINRLESFQIVTLNNDVILQDDTDTLVATAVMPALGDSQGSAHLTFELPSDIAPVTRLIVAWIEGIGTVTVTGPASGQLTLHQALPYGTLSIGPVRAVNTGVAGNVVLYVRVTPVGAGPAPTDRAVMKAATSVLGTATAKPLATGLIAR